MVTGEEVTNITLDGVVETNIQYQTMQQLADIINFGPGTVYINWRKTAVVGDTNCLMLPESMSYELHPTGGWNVLSIISDQESSVQVVIR